MFQHYLHTKDNIKIALNHYKSGFKEVVIIAHGWCMTKDSNAFKKISEAFNKNFDVITFDFRGHGKSKGFFTFTAKEIYDIECVVEFAKNQGYKKIHLAGFSLGAAISLIYASNSFVDNIIAVSAPCEFNKIENQMYKKEAWLETFKKFELKRFLSIRPHIFPFKKIKPIEIVEKINCPILFISGEFDPTVHPWHTEILYKKAQTKKEYKMYKNGFHAEDLFLYFEDDFMEACNNWLKN